MCNHNRVQVLRRDGKVSLFECIDCLLVTEHPGRTEWRSRKAEDPEAKKPEEKKAE